MSKYLLLAAALVIMLSCSKKDKTVGPPTAETHSIAIYNMTPSNRVEVGIGDQYVDLDYLESATFNDFTSGKYYMIGAYAIFSEPNWHRAELIGGSAVAIYIFLPDSIKVIY